MVPGICYIEKEMELIGRPTVKLDHLISGYSCCSGFTVIFARQFGVAKNHEITSSLEELIS